MHRGHRSRLSLISYMLCEAGRDNEPMVNPRVLDNHELEAELAALRRGRDASMDEGASEASVAETDLLIERFEAEIRARHQEPTAED